MKELKTVFSKTINTKKEYEVLIDKLVKEGYTWCDGTEISGKNLYPNDFFELAFEPFCIRGFNDKTIYWSYLDEPERNFYYDD